MLFRSTGICPIGRWKLPTFCLQLRKEMDALVATLPEYGTVMGIYGVGKTYGPQLIAEIGDVSRFTHREALTAFAGADPGVDESGS